MYKLVAFDLDGTLLNDEKKILDKNLDIIHNLMENGVEVIISTGRGYVSCERLVKDIKDDITCICNNGAIARTLHSYEEIFATYMDPLEVKNILELADKIGTTPLIHVNGFYNNIDVVYRKDNLKFSPENRNKNSSLRYKEINSYNDYDFDDVLALAFFDDKIKTKELYEKTKNIYNEGFSYHFMENTSSDNSLVEYMAKDINKWNGIKKYAKLKSISEEEIIVFGDDNNDYEMIKNAKVGVAMSNATDKVKSVADIVLDTDNNENSIYNLLNKLFK